MYSPSFLFSLQTAKKILKEWGERDPNGAVISVIKEQEKGGGGGGGRGEEEEVKVGYTAGGIVFMVEKNLEGFCFCFFFVFVLVF